VGGKEMKQHIKQPEPVSRPFWAVSKHSASGIAHLVEPKTISDDMPFLADYPASYSSACGLRYAWFELMSAGSSGIGAPRCKRCLASKDKDNAGI
jgi:hypothetical protein